MTQDKQGVPDWERIETDFRVGRLSLREIAALDGNVTEGAIRKRAKRDGWVRDLGPKITARAEALVRKEAVRSEVRKNGEATERQIVEANSVHLASVLVGQQSDISRHRTLAMRLLEELERQTSAVPELEKLGEILYSPDRNGTDKLNELYHKVISTPGRTKTMKDLADTLKTLVALEREAYGLGQQSESAAGDASTKDMTENERARRIAFALVKGLKPKE